MRMGTDLEKGLTPEYKNVACQRKHNPIRKSEKFIEKGGNDGDERREKRCEREERWQRKVTRPRGLRYDPRTRPRKKIRKRNPRHNRHRTMLGEEG